MGRRLVHGDTVVHLLNTRDLLDHGQCNLSRAEGRHTTSESGGSFVKIAAEFLDGYIGTRLELTPNFAENWVADSVASGRRETRNLVVC